MNIRTCMMLYRIWMGCVLRRICMALLWICRALLRICRALLRTCMGSVLSRIYIWEEQGEHHNKPLLHNMFNIFLIYIFFVSNRSNSTSEYRVAKTHRMHYFDT